MKFRFPFFSKKQPTTFPLTPPEPPLLQASEVKPIVIGDFQRTCIFPSTTVTNASEGQIVTFTEECATCINANANATATPGMMQQIVNPVPTPKPQARLPETRDPGLTMTPAQARRLRTAITNAAKGKKRQNIRPRPRSEKQVP